MPTQCNSTLDDIRIVGEKNIAGPFTFHQLIEIIAGACAAFSILCSGFLMFRHATNYTKPSEQKYILRILFMVPVYGVSAFLQIKYYWHAIYFSTITDCYEAFAIASFFALLCQYTAPDLHEQKNFFRELQPIRPWIWPLSWFKACCCGERGPWRTPSSGLTWFNIVWIGVYHYCFVRVAMTITAVVLQYFGQYCENSDNPRFGHVWVLVIDSIAVTIAMYVIIQFYLQLRGELAAHRPLLKVAAIKLVIFLSFWQSLAISLATTEQVVKANDIWAYPDIAWGMPSVLICFEMALFSILHQFAYPWKPYRQDAPPIFYPMPHSESTKEPRQNEHCPPAGGPLGVRAFWDAINLWDVVKAFGRGMRWLFVGVRKRHDDVSYHHNTGLSNTTNGKPGGDTAYPMQPYGKSTDHLPIAQRFRRSKFGPEGALNAAGQQQQQRNGGAHTGVVRNGPEPNSPMMPAHEDRAALIPNAQFSPQARLAPQRSPYENTNADGDGERHQQARQVQQQWHNSNRLPMVGQASSTDDSGYGQSLAQSQQYQRDSAGSANADSYYYHGAPGPAEYDATGTNPAAGGNPRNSTQLKIGQALWGGRPGQAM